MSQIYKHKLPTSARHELTLLLVVCKNSYKSSVVLILEIGDYNNLS